MKKPTEVNILGMPYKINYVDSVSDVDIHRRESLWGQIDYWTHSIRIYDGERSIESIWKTILHEVAHGVVTHLRIKVISDAENKEDVIELLALGMADVLIRNGWLAK
jgi:hypothetical protein